MSGYPSTVLDMADSGSAREALYEAITAAAKDIDPDMNDVSRSHAIANLALAFRYASGGPQPGGAPASE